MNYIIFRTTAVLITSYITKVGVPLVFAWSTGLTALLAAITIALINHTVKPILQLISIPIHFFTLGLISFVINGVCILLAAKIVDGFSIPSLAMAVWFSIVLAVVNWVLHIFE